MTTLKNQPDLDVLFNNMADGVYLLEPETSNILWCNRAAYEDLGFEKEEVLNHSVLSLQKTSSANHNGMKSPRSSKPTKPIPSSVAIFIKRRRNCG